MTDDDKGQSGNIFHALASLRTTFRAAVDNAGGLQAAYAGKAARHLLIGFEKPTALPVLLIP